jgi:glycosyltransferase involved in cell wall biosynthesis
MTPTALVSVIMPFRNVRLYIAEAIDSVLAQTHGAWELWLVDDGSTDGSAEVARTYAAREPSRIRLLAHSDGQNHGISASRNLALTQCQGEFVAFLDADDLWLPDSLAAHISHLQHTPEAGAVYSRTLYWYSWLQGARQKDYAPRLRIRTGRAIAGGRLLARCIRGESAVPCTCSIVVRRSALTRLGGFEAEFPQLYEDQVFYAKLFAHNRILPIEGCWSKYRRHAASTTMTTQAAGEFRGWRLAYLTWLEGYARREPALFAELRPALRRELWRCRHPWADWFLDQTTAFRRRLARLGRGG